MINLVTAPKPWGQLSVFLAGGVTTPDWREEFITKAIAEIPDNLSLTILNPVRLQWDNLSYEELQEQVRWEATGLERADTVVFWFPAGSLCPMTLFELGKVVKSNKPYVLGVEDEYPRKADISAQPLGEGLRGGQAHSIDELVLRFRWHIIERMKG